jgi:glycerol-3-phosphate acyltransferase PlsX
VFLGLNGVVVKSHGKTDEVSFASAVEVADDMARYNLLDLVQASLNADALVSARAAFGSASLPAGEAVEVSPPRPQPRR